MSAAAQELPLRVRRNTLLLAASLAANSAMMQLSAAVASLALLGGLALTALGVAALAIGGTLLVLAPALWIVRTARAPAPAGAID